MDDVLQPRSRHSWDVLKAWFKVGPNAIGNGCIETKEAAATGGTAESPEESGSRSHTDGDGGTDVQETPSGGLSGSGGIDGRLGEGGVSSGGAAAPEVPPKRPTDGASAADTAAATTVPACATASAAEGDDAVAAFAEVDGNGVLGGDGDPAPKAGPQADSGGGHDAIADPHGAGADGGGDDGGGSWSVKECYVRFNGMCENCGEVLRSIDLPKDEEERLLKQVGRRYECLALFHPDLSILISTSLRDNQCRDEEPFPKIRVRLAPGCEGVLMARVSSSIVT